jgi:hypothetical protein
MCVTYKCLFDTVALQWTMTMNDGAVIPGCGNSAKSSVSTNLLGFGNPCCYGGGLLMLEWCYFVNA